MKVVSTTSPIVSATLDDAASVAWTATAGTFTNAAGVNPGYSLPILTASITAPITITATFTAAGAALSFTDSAAYDIPASTVGTAIASIDVSGSVSGGTAPYTFSASGLPNGITINNTTGVISGTPIAAGSAGIATITVTDNTSANQTITILYGTISAAPLPTYSLSVSAGTGGSIQGGSTNDGNYTSGTAINVTVVPDANYVFDGWTATGITPSNTETISFNMPANAVTLTANFQLVGDEPYVSPSTLNITTGQKANFTISLGSSGNAATSATITSNNTGIVTATPTDTTASTTTVEVTGESAGTTTISIGWSGGPSDNTTSTVTVNVSDPAPVSHTITASAGAGGSISPSGAVTVNDGASQTFTITANSGYEISQVLVDGMNDSAAVSSGSYTFSNVSGDHTIAVSFTAIGATTHTITASAGAGGSISPSGSVTVNDGGSQTFNITANSGYQILQVLVDGVNIPAAVSSGSYTFSNVSGNHSIAASYAAENNGNNGGGNGGSGGGNGSNSGSSGGGSVSDNTTWTTTATSDTNMPTLGKLILTTAPNQNGVLNTTITKEMVQQALDKAQEEAKKQGRTSYGYSLEILFSTDKTISDINITFDSNALALLASAGVKETTVTTNSFRFSFDLAAIKQLNSQSDNSAVTVTASPFSKLSDAAKRLIGTRSVWDITVSFNKGGKTHNITNLGSGFITMGIKYSPRSGEKTGNLAVVYVPGNGKPQIIIQSSYDSGWMIWQRSSLSVYGVGYIADAPVFADVAGHWAKDNIDFVASRGLLNGTSATEFSPNQTITRGMFITALGRLSGEDVSAYKTSSFSDVAADSYYLAYIEWAVANNIVSGVGGGRFAPDSPITREQMAVMMQNYATATGYKIPVVREQITFADAGSISSYAKDAVIAMQQSGIIIGRGNNQFAPQANATRAEAATILRRFVELVIDDSTARGWVQNESGQWQYVNIYGKIVTGWITTTEGTKYWLDDKGVMVQGQWLQIGGKWYYFYTNGKLATNATIDGYTVGEDGARQ